MAERMSSGSEEDFIPAKRRRSKRLLANASSGSSDSSVADFESDVESFVSNVTVSSAEPASSPVRNCEQHPEANRSSHSDVSDEASLASFGYENGRAHDDQDADEAIHDGASESSSTSSEGSFPPLHEAHPDLAAFEELEQEIPVQEQEEELSELDDNDDHLDGEEFEEDAPEAGLPGYDPPLYVGSPLTLGQSMLAILTYSITHNLTGAALADLLSLVALHCIAQNNTCKTTLYKFKKYFEAIKSPLAFKFFCSNCFASLASKTDVCQHCPENTSVSYFLQVSIIAQLQSMFKREGFSEKLQFKRTRIKKNEQHYEDIYDGQVYKEKERSGFFNNRYSLSMIWNSDGVRIFKSSKLSVWPLFLSINELPYTLRFSREFTVIAGLWFGLSKPKLPLFLESFHEDLQQLFNGLDLDLPGNRGKVSVKGTILCGTCDMPAKAHFLNIVQYNGYYGCPNCLIHGERSDQTDGQHCYPFQENITPRTLNDTNRYAPLAQQYGIPIYGYKGVSCLGLYVEDYIKSTACDIMHLLYEGCVKKLLHLWFDVELRQSDFSLYNAVNAVNDLLIKLTPPSFVKRLPRSITEHLSYWKASEFKTWFFYYSVPILESIMTEEYFNHYLLLFHAMVLLNQESISEEMITEAEQCLKEFLRKFSILYEVKYMTINFHMLLHLGDCVRKFGPLWTTSCMKFENLNGILKKLVHGTTHAALQITSGLSQMVNLPILLSELPLNNSTRKWCTDLMCRDALKINEVISENLSSLGTYKKIISHDVQNALADGGIAGNFSVFYRLKKGKTVIFSRSYDRQLKSCSFAVKYSKNNVCKFGLIECFVRVSECQCRPNPCRCPAEFFAVLSELQVHEPFSISFDEDEFLDIINIPHVMRVEEDGRLEVVHVSSLQVLCFCVSVQNNMYIVPPVNCIEDE